MYHKLGNNNGC